MSLRLLLAVFLHPLKKRVQNAKMERSFVFVFKLVHWVFSFFYGVFVLKLPRKAVFLQKVGKKNAGFPLFFGPFFGVGAGFCAFWLSFLLLVLLNSHGFRAFLAFFGNFGGVPVAFFVTRIFWRGFSLSFFGRKTLAAFFGGFSVSLTLSAGCSKAL